MVTLADSITNSLASLSPTTLDITDESGQHLGHAGYRPGGSHFRVDIVSARFAGKSRIERHRMVYAALGPVMQDVHALAINARTPDEL